MLGSPWPQVAGTPDGSHARRGDADLTHAGPQPGPCGRGHCPTGPRGARGGQTHGAWGGCPSVRSPTNASDLYSFFLCFVLLFHPTSIVCVCGGRHLGVQKKSRPVLVLCRHRHQGRNEADTNMRQAGRGRAAGLQTPSLSREAGRSSGGGGAWGSAHVCPPGGGGG